MDRRSDSHKAGARTGRAKAVSVLTYVIAALFLVKFFAVV